MLRVHFSTGETQSFDLDDAAQLATWRTLSGLDEFQTSIRGISIVADGALHALPAPRRFRHRQFGAEPLNGSSPGLSVWCQADGVRVTLVTKGDPLSVRVNLERTGEMRFRPGR